MSDKTISFKHKVTGALADATSVVLRDATNAYGLRRADTLAVVFIAGTPLTHDGTGLYSISATGLATGTTYQYAVEWVYAGETRRAVRTFTTPPASAAGISKWTVTVIPGASPIDTNLVSTHLRLEGSDNDATYLQFLIDAATDHAQDSLEQSLITQTITAAFNAEDVELTPPIRDYPADPLNPLGSPLAVPLNTWGTYGRSPVVRLPRGPVQSVVSVLDAKGSAVSYGLERTPAGDRLRLNGPLNYPVTAVYVAGYGDVSTKVPAATRAAILTHVATLYENRMSVTANMKALPHSMEDFYRLKTRRLIGG